MANREPEGDEFGVLVIQVWDEPESDHPFRARLTYRRGDTETAVTEATSDPDDVVEAVRRWLVERARKVTNP